MPLKVIGAGQPRTGTMSLKVALEELGFGPCHHMIEVFTRPHLPPLWARAFQGVLGDYEEIFKDYNATTDAPSAFVYDKLAARYPDAKVILSTRDPEKWHASMLATILSARSPQHATGSPIAEMFQSMRDYMIKRGGGTATDLGRDVSREAMIADFNRHNEEVKRTIAPERLLVFEAAQGWEPLCAFLGVPVPKTPFPRVNDTQQFHDTTVPAVQRGVAPDQGGEAPP